MRYRRDIEAVEPLWIAASQSSSIWIVKVHLEKRLWHLKTSRASPQESDNTPRKLESAEVARSRFVPAFVPASESNSSREPALDGGITTRPHSPPKAHPLIVTHCLN